MVTCAQLLSSVSLLVAADALQARKTAPRKPGSAAGALVLLWMTGSGDGAMQGRLSIPDKVIVLRDLMQAHCKEEKTQDPASIRGESPSTGCPAYLPLGEDGDIKRGAAGGQEGASGGVYEIMGAIKELSGVDTSAWPSRQLTHRRLGSKFKPAVCFCSA